MIKNIEGKLFDSESCDKMVAELDAQETDILEVQHHIDSIGQNSFVLVDLADSTGGNLHLKFDESVNPIDIWKKLIEVEQLLETINKRNREISQIFEN